MFILDPGPWNLGIYPGCRIPNPTTATKEKGEKICYKIENYFIFELVKKQIFSQFTKIQCFFT